MTDELATARAEIAALTEDRRSWRAVAERLEGEKQALQKRITRLTTVSDEDVERANHAYIDEAGRWKVQCAGGKDQICRRDDHERVKVVKTVPQGDGPMHFYDIRDRACARAALEAHTAKNGGGV